MWIRLTRRLADYIDGVDLSRRSVGDLLDLPERDAEMLVAEGCALALEREPQKTHWQSCRSKRLIPSEQETTRLTGAPSDVQCVSTARGESIFQACAGIASIDALSKALTSSILVGVLRCRACGSRIHRHAAIGSWTRFLQ
jgi:hypothetical protein